MLFILSITEYVQNVLLFNPKFLKYRQKDEPCFPTKSLDGGTVFTTVPG
jgi:hypothetical protein